MNWIARLAAELIALAAVVGILIHVEAQMRASGSVLTTAWVLLGLGAAMIAARRRRPGKE